MMGFHLIYFFEVLKKNAEKFPPVDTRLTCCDKKKDNSFYKNVTVRGYDSINDGILI